MQLSRLSVISQARGWRRGGTGGCPIRAAAAPWEPIALHPSAARAKGRHPDRSRPGLSRSALHPRPKSPAEPLLCATWAEREGLRARRKPRAQGTGMAGKCAQTCGGRVLGVWPTIIEPSVWRLASGYTGLSWSREGEPAGIVSIVFSWECYSSIACPAKRRGPQSRRAE